MYFLLFAQARAKENLWRKYQEGKGGEKGDTDEELEDAWMRVGESILTLEEKGNWLEPEKEIGRIVVGMRASRLTSTQSGTCEVVDKADKVKVISKEDNLAEEGIPGVILCWGRSFCVCLQA